MDTLLTTFTIGLLLILFLKVSVLLKIEVYLLTDAARRARSEMVSLVGKIIPTLCVPGMMFSRSNRNCCTVSFHAQPRREREDQPDIEPLVCICVDGVVFTAELFRRNTLLQRLGLSCGPVFVRATDVQRSPVSRPWMVQ